MEHISCEKISDIQSPQKQPPSGYPMTSKERVRPGGDQETPLENVLAMFDAIEEFGRY